MDESHSLRDQRAGCKGGESPHKKSRGTDNESKGGGWDARQLSS